MIRARIVGVGHAVPSRVVTNAELSTLMDTSDEWIVERTGIRERRWARAKGVEPTTSVTNSELGARAIERALEIARIDKDKVDAIYYATISPESEIAGSGVYCAKRLFGARPVKVIEVRNQCAGFLFALSMANAAIRAGRIRCAAVVGAEVLSTGLDVSDAGRHMSVLFGDGAGAVIVEPDNSGSAGIIEVELHTDGSSAELLGVPGPSFVQTPRLSRGLQEIYPIMEGKVVFKAASQAMPQVVMSVLSRSSLSIPEVDLIVPHQANARILSMVGEALRCPQKVFSNIERYGNTTAASIPLALSEAWEAGRVKEGNVLCLVAFGAGFSWGAVSLKW